MTYLFVHAFHDLGLRKGPIAGVNIHMAEGGGTVGFLSRQNGDGVSVHYVIEYSGRIVQMLLESHMQSAIRIHKPDGSYAIRQDMDGMWGHKVAVAVLGAWADTHTTLGPNHATIGVEIEGYRVIGPNAAQHDALAHLVADIRTRHPKIGTTGHRDHNVKGCPGDFIQWSRLGGHGAFAAPAPSTEDTVPGPAIDFDVTHDPVPWDALGKAVVKAPSTSLLSLADGSNVWADVPVGTALGVVQLATLKEQWHTWGSPGLRLVVTNYNGKAAWTTLNEVDFQPLKAPLDTTPYDAAALAAAKAGERERVRAAAIKGAGDAIDALPR